MYSRDKWFLLIFLGVGTNMDTYGLVVIKIGGRSVHCSVFSSRSLFYTTLLRSTEVSRVRRSRITDPRWRSLGQGNFQTSFCSTTTLSDLETKKLVKFGETSTTHTWSFPLLQTHKDSSRFLSTNTYIYVCLNTHLRE